MPLCYMLDLLSYNLLLLIFMKMQFFQCFLETMFNIGNMLGKWLISLINSGLYPNLQLSSNVVLMCSELIIFVISIQIIRSPVLYWREVYACDVYITCVPGNAISVFVTFKSCTYVIRVVIATVKSHSYIGPFWMTNCWE